MPRATAAITYIATRRSPDRFLHLRYWTSPEMRAEAHADPDVHRYWLKLPELCTIPIVYESLEKVFES